MLTFYLSLLADPEDGCQFEQFYHAVQKRMLHYANGILNNHADAEEAVQEAFTSLAIHFDQLRQLSMDELSAYFMVIVRNSAISRYRSNRRRRQMEVPDEFVMQAGQNEQTSQKVSDLITVDFEEKNTVEDAVLEKLCNQMEYERVVSAIEGLPPLYREVLLLRLVYELPMSKIAKRLGRSTSNIAQQFHRGKAKLYQMLKEEDTDETDCCTSKQ